MKAFIVEKQETIFAALEADLGKCHFESAITETGAAIMGGVTGAIMGGMAGVDHAVNVDSVDLPTLDEYEQLVKNGDKLVVVLGDHDKVMRAEKSSRKCCTSAATSIWCTDTSTTNIQLTTFPKPELRQRNDWLLG